MNHKRILLSSLLLLLSFTIYGQALSVTGQFKYQQSSNGNRVLCFQGTNVSGYNLVNLTITCVNEDNDERKVLKLPYLSNRGTFYVGPNEGWSWETGEKLFVKFANGQSVYWTNTNSRSNSYNTQSIQRQNTSSKLQVESLRLKISQLEYKIKDANRSLENFKASGDRNPTMSNSMLQQQQLRLIQTYETQLTIYESQLENL